jgi:hypothetical protein
MPESGFPAVEKIYILFKNIERAYSLRIFVLFEK